MTHTGTPPEESGSGPPNAVPTSDESLMLQVPVLQLSRATLTLASEVASELWAMPVQPVSRSEPGLLVIVNVSLSPAQSPPPPPPGVDVGAGLVELVIEVAVLGMVLGD